MTTPIIDFNVKDKPIIDIILNNRGSIYGGYLRDYFRGKHANDIDCVASIEDEEAIMTGLKALYKSEPIFNRYNGTYIFKDVEGLLLDCEIYFVEDDPVHIYIGPVSEPDFDVNLLTYSIFKDRFLYSWIDPNQDTEPIIKAIHEGDARQLSPAVLQERREKIIKRGFKII